MIGYEGDNDTMKEYKVCKWGYVEELEDIMNYMVKKGWVFESITQPPKVGYDCGTVMFSKLTYPESKRIDEGEEDE